MPSKKSKPRPAPPFPAKPWKDAPGCDERAVIRLAQELAESTRPGDRVLLEGELGAGKTTFARAFLEALGVDLGGEGSPTFALVHEYDLAVHIDLYRLRSEGEIDESGITSLFWPDPQQDARVLLCEWLSLWSAFEQAVLSQGRNWRIQIAFEKKPGLRTVIIRQP